MFIIIICISLFLVQSYIIIILQENTTWDLVSDLEKLREHLGVDKWVLFGGSWGSTLALAYSQTHPDSVKALIIYGVAIFKKYEGVMYGCIFIHLLWNELIVYTRT